MYSYLSVFVAKILLKNGSFEKEDFDIYAFGLEKIISNIFGIIFLGIVAFFLSAPVEALIFYFAFKHMRIYAGGYHASTYTKCNITYLLTFVFAVLFSKYLQILEISIIFYIFSLISVLLLSPIENPNNPIIEGRYYRYYFYSVLTVILLGIIQSILINFEINLHYILSVTMFLSAMFMWVEIIKRRENPMMQMKKRLCDLIAKKAAKSAIISRREVSYNRMHQPKAPKNLDSFSKK